MPFLILFFSDTAITEMYTLSLHDALPIFHERTSLLLFGKYSIKSFLSICFKEDRKSTRLNSSHVSISYAVFCLKKKIDEETVVDYEFNQSQSNSDRVNYIL